LLPSIACRAFFINVRNLDLISMLRVRRFTRFALGEGIDKQ